MPALNLDTVVVRTPDLITTEMDGEVVMLDIARGEYFGIGGIGPRIWQLLESARPLSELCRTLCQEFHVDAETCRNDTLAFVGELIDSGLVKAN